MSSNRRQEDAELRRATREIRRDNRLGADAYCETCGDTNTVHLSRMGGLTLCGCCLAVGRGRAIFELHHIAAQHEGATLRVCANCHAELTELQRDWAEDLDFDARFSLGLEDIRSVRQLSRGRQ